MSPASELEGCRALLVSVRTRRRPTLAAGYLATEQREQPASQAAETSDFVELALATGINPSLTMELNVAKPTPNFYLGKGNVELIAEHAIAQEVDLVAINAPLSSVHQRNWEERLKLPLLTRQDLIFAIFQANAHTAEGKLQVELARLKYELPRVVRSYEKLDPLAGGIGTIGPGEQLTERIKRIHRKRIQEIEKRLEKLQGQRQLRRKLRQESGLFTISIVGYTNVGKSTLLNRLTGGGVLVENKYFATLDPAVRNLHLPDGSKALLTDTVGFISDLPAELITSFRATLDEMAGSHLLLHLADASHPNVEQQIQSVRRIVAQIGLGAVDELLVFNKADRVDEEAAQALTWHWPDSLQISAATGDGLKRLLAEMARRRTSQLRGCGLGDLTETSPMPVRSL